MLSLRRRRDAPQPEGGRIEVDTPKYPTNEEAFEYRSASTSLVVDEQIVSESENLLLRANIKPLPRCPACNTAVGSGQRDCHSCGKNLRRTL